MHRKMMNIIEIYNRFKECGCVTTDTRTLKGGEMFFALKGENFDGNEYAVKALEAGAAYAVVNASSSVGQQAESGDVAADIAARLIVVEDTLQTLQELARCMIAEAVPLVTIFALSSWSRMDWLGMACSIRLICSSARLLTRA